MYKLHLLQHPDWYRTGTSYCYFYIFEIIHHHSVIFSKTYPSFLTVKEGSTFLTKPLFPQGREDVTALRCSEPLRYKVGEPIKGLARLCGMGPHGWHSLSVIYPPKSLGACRLYTNWKTLYFHQYASINNLQIIF